MWQNNKIIRCWKFSISHNFVIFKTAEIIIFAQHLTKQKPEGRTWKYTAIKRNNILICVSLTIHCVKHVNTLKKFYFPNKKNLNHFSWLHLFIHIQLHFNLNLIKTIFYVHLLQLHFKKPENRMNKGKVLVFKFWIWALFFRRKGMQQHWNLSFEFYIHHIYAKRKLTYLTSCSN